MQCEVLEDAEAVATHGAATIAAAAREAVKTRGRFVVAISGGRTPWRMLRLLADEDVPWRDVHVVQVDERVAPAGDPERNLVHLRESLGQVLRRGEQIYPMPVELPDLTTASRRYADTLIELAGSPPLLDLVHLGLGSDGHTASLVPNDAVLDIADRCVAVTELYRGHRRMTLTYPLIDRARRILWVVTGAEKRVALAQLRARDRSIPAGRVRALHALVLADRAAAPL